LGQDCKQRIGDLNFSPVISWARNTSYDVVGIIILGYVALLLLTVFVFYFPGISFVFDAIVDNSSIEKYSLGIQGNILFVTLLAYLVGFFIKSIGDSVTKTGYTNDIYFRKFFLSGQKIIRPNYSSSSEELLPHAAKAINKYLSKNDRSADFVPVAESNWFRFYQFSQSILEVNQFPTKSITYQNRYELFKSLSIVFGLFCILAIGNIAITFLLVVTSFSLSSLNDLIFAIFICGSLYIFSLQSRNLYIKFWRNLGDTLITSIIVVFPIQNTFRFTTWR